MSGALQLMPQNRRILESDMYESTRVYIGNKVISSLWTIMDGEAFGWRNEARGTVRRP